MIGMKNNPMGKSGKSGFTLIELLIALVISAIVLTAMVSVFTDQSKTFQTQSELARSQASARMALYMIARDLRMAGFTGAPRGVANLANPINPNQVYPVISVKNGNSVIVGVSESVTLGNDIKTNANSSRGGGDEYTDAVEIWGNFQRQTTYPTFGAGAGTNSITVLSGDGAMFTDASDFNKPGWLVVSEGFSSNMYEISSVSGDLITISGAFSTAVSNKAIISPFYRRVYYVNTDETDDRGNKEYNLYMCNCTAAGCDLDDDDQNLILARGVDDFQVTYRNANATKAALSAGEIMAEEGILCNPCRLRSVTVSLWTRSDKFRDEDRPIRRRFSTTVKPRNLSVESFDCQIVGCTP